MHQCPSPFPPLNTRSQRHPASDTSSPPSSRTTSPPSSPTSTLRRRHQPTQVSPHHLFNLSFHPTTTTTTHPKDYDTGSRPQDRHIHGNVHNHESNASTQCGVSILPCAVLRGRSSLMIVRRRPSAVDMALSEERCRCDENAIERQGLDLMEPRPVDMNLNMNLNMGVNIDLARRDSVSRASIGSDTRSVLVQQPRFVMGGIFEVMEGRA
ncbi:uncharacterized protein N7496_011316 [Penicillium cataractarum]|uniref:Uncharacterized protein n=1 Tax=Penicillium cataractarum TaxID=2100454 RepID=A0A9W9RJX2_9EURO|nr:uncharacterized protein N7496_011316 [Penicillium cataractarum]KAJ5358903.1 hypothetical protein N7496_011316 [Penicillium cataractarum]